MNHAKLILNKVFMNGNSRNLDNSKCFWTAERQCITNCSQLNIKTLFMFLLNLSSYLCRNGDKWFYHLVLDQCYTQSVKILSSILTPAVILVFASQLALGLCYPYHQEHCYISFRAEGTGTSENVHRSMYSFQRLKKGKIPTAEKFWVFFSV